MGCYFSNPNKRNKEGHNKREQKENNSCNNKAHDHKTETVNGVDKTVVNGNKSTRTKYSSEDRFTSNKNRKGKNGCTTVTSNKINVQGNFYEIGHGANIVTVNISDGMQQEPKGGNKRGSKDLSKHRVTKLDFSKLRPRREDEAFHLPACFMQFTDSCRDVAHLEILAEAAKSVGKIYAQDICGTVFRVGPKYIMTCKHVLDGIKRAERNLSAGLSESNCAKVLENQSVYVDFNFIHRSDTNPRDRTNIFFLTSNVKFQDNELDVAVLELKERDDIEMPPAFIYFGHATPLNKFSFIGHPQGDVKKENEVNGPVELNEEIYQIAEQRSNELVGFNGFEGMMNPGRLLFHCSFEKGASGSPGIAIGAGRKAVVVTMLLCGYPTWFYDPSLDAQIREGVSRNQRIEQGVNMCSLHKKMKRVNNDLCISIFGLNP